MANKDQSLVIITLPMSNLPMPIQRIYPRFSESDHESIRVESATNGSNKLLWTFLFHCSADVISVRESRAEMNVTYTSPNQRHWVLQAGITSKQMASPSGILQPLIWYENDRSLEISRFMTPKSEKHGGQVTVTDIAWRRDGEYGAILSSGAVLLLDAALRLVARWIQPDADELHSLLWCGRGLLFSTASHVRVLGLDGAVSVIASLFPWGTGCRLCAVNSDVLMYLAGPGGPGSRPNLVVRSLGMLEPVILGILSESNLTSSPADTCIPSSEREKVCEPAACNGNSSIPAHMELSLEDKLVQVVTRGNRNKISTGLLCRIAAKRFGSNSIVDRIWGVGGSGLNWLSWKGQYCVAWSGQDWRACLVLLLNRPSPPEGPVLISQYFYRLAVAATAGQDLGIATAALWAAGEDYALIQLIVDTQDSQGFAEDISKPKPVLGNARIQNPIESVWAVTKFFAKQSFDLMFQIAFQKALQVRFSSNGLIEHSLAWPYTVPMRARYLSQDLIRRGFKAGSLPSTSALDDLEALDRFARSDDLSEWIGAATSLAREASVGNTTASPAASSYGSESRGSHSVASRAGSREGSTSATSELGRPSRSQPPVVGPGGTGYLWSADSLSGASRHGADSTQGGGGDGGDDWLSGNRKGDGVGERGAATDVASQRDDDDDDWGDGGKEMEAKTKIQLVGYLIGSVARSAACSIFTDHKGCASP
jgi:hypothetical protein